MAFLIIHYSLFISILCKDSANERQRKIKVRENSIYFDVLRLFAPSPP